ncbi:MAG: short-chain dehydrogenase, partial [Sphingomonadaceae bacterium]
IGIAVGGNMNWSLVLAVLAALCAEAGEPLPMPAGNSGIFEMTDSDLIAAASEWAFTTPAARNQVFNMTNGDVFALHDIFPILADSFGIALTEPRRVDIAGELARLAHLWPAIVDRYGLVAPRELNALLGATPQIVSAWGESMPPERKLMSGLSSTIKLRQAGFQGCADSADTIRKYVERYRELRILP